MRRIENCRKSVFGKLLICFIFFNVDQTSADDNTTELMTEAQRMWENTTRFKVSTAPKKSLEASNSPVILITWFPWFEITTDPSESNEETNSPLPNEGVGTWREVVLSRRMESRDYLPGSSALCVNTAVGLSIKPVFIILSVYFLFYFEFLFS